MFRRNPDAIALVILVLLLTVGGVRIGDAGIGIVPPPPLGAGGGKTLVIGKGVSGVVGSLLKQWIHNRPPL